jgi:hypothetical protein
VDQVRFKGDAILVGKIIDSLVLQTVPSDAIPGDYILGPGNSITGMAVIGSPTIKGRFIPHTSNGTMEFRNYYTGSGGIIDFYTKGTQLNLELSTNGDATFGYNGIFDVGNGVKNNYGNHLDQFIPTSGQGETQIINSWYAGSFGGTGFYTNQGSGTAVENLKNWQSGSWKLQPNNFVAVESPSSVFDIISTTKGSSLIPRMTTTQRDAISKESIQSITVTNGGTGYTNGTVFNITGGSTAIGTIAVTGGVITAFNITNPGYGYTGSPTSFTVTPTGTGATITSTLGWMNGLMIYNTDNGHYEYTYQNAWVRIPNSSDGPYQPLENQRLSTSNAPTFNGITSNGQVGTVVNTGTLPDIKIINGSTPGSTELFQEYSTQNSGGGHTNFLLGATGNSGTGSYSVNINYRPIGGTVALLSDIADAMYTASDANLTVPAFSAYGDFVTLPAITANRTVTLPAASGLTGQHIKLRNMNASGNAWSFASTVKDAGGTTITDIANLAFTIIESDGTNWVKTN